MVRGGVVLQDNYSRRWLQVWGWLGMDGRCRAPGEHLGGLKYRKGELHQSERIQVLRGEVWVMAEYGWGNTCWYQWDLFRQYKFHSWSFGKCSPCCPNSKKKVSHSKKTHFPHWEIFICVQSHMLVMGQAWEKWEVDERRYFSSGEM